VGRKPVVHVSEVIFQAEQIDVLDFGCAVIGSGPGFSSANWASSRFLIRSAIPEQMKRGSATRVMALLPSRLEIGGSAIGVLITDDECHERVR
jgi:hypothetical protein